MGVRVLVVPDEANEGSTARSRRRFELFLFWFHHLACTHSFVGGHLPLSMTSVVSTAMISCYGEWSRETLHLPSPGVQGTVTGPVSVRSHTLDHSGLWLWAGVAKSKEGIYSWHWHLWHPAVAAELAIQGLVLPSGLQSPLRSSSFPSQTGILWACHHLHKTPLSV